MKYYISVLKKYAVFTGRARRAEYWYFVLFNMIITWVLNLIGPASYGGYGDARGMTLLALLYSLAVLLPGIGVAIRRLHDTGRSGWWLLIGLVPFIGWVVLIVFAVLDSQPGANQYGANPKEGETTTPPPAPQTPVA